jgi:hypothetical protein
MLLAIFCVIDSFVAAAPNGTAIKRESFDDDPGWEGRNNRMIMKDPPMVIQDFGYSPTHYAGRQPGEIGGQM